MWFVFRTLQSAINFFLMKWMIQKMIITRVIEKSVNGPSKILLNIANWSCCKPANITFFHKLVTSI